MGDDAAMNHRGPFVVEAMLLFEIFGDYLA